MKRHERLGWGALSALFWLLVWQGASMLLGRSILLPSPLETAAALGRLLLQPDFWRAAARSLLSIQLGFLAALALAGFLALSAFLWRLPRQLLRLPMSAIRATPVAAFALMAFFLVGSRWLACFLAALLALPVLYASVYAGLCSVPKPQLEAAALFGLSPLWRLRFLHLPAAWPFLLSGCESAVGLCWKAGTAAEVLALAAGTLGEALYDAKLLIDTPAVFAVTAVIVLLSLCCERATLALLRRAGRRIL